MPENSRQVDHSAPVSARTGGFALERVLFAAFALNLLLVFARLLKPGLLGAAGAVPEVTLLVLAACASAASLARELPAQNVVLAVVLIVALSFAMDLVISAARLALEPPQDRGNASISIFWAAPLIRVFTLLNSRGLARLLLRSKLQNPNYGLWVLGLTALLAFVLEMDLALVLRFWSADAGGSLAASWIASGCNLLALVVVVSFVTPSLIVKRPGGREFQPAATAACGAWFSAALLFLTSAAIHALWPIAGLILLELAVLAVALFLRHPA